MLKIAFLILFDPNSIDLLHCCIERFAMITLLNIGYYLLWLLLGPSLFLARSFLLSFDQRRNVVDKVFIGDSVEISRSSLCEHLPFLLIFFADVPNDCDNYDDHNQTKYQQREL